MNTVFFSISTMSENEEKVKTRMAELEEDFTDKKLLRLCLEMGLEATGTKREKAGRIAQAEMQNHQRYARGRKSHRGNAERIQLNTSGRRRATSASPGDGTTWRKCLT